jgi:Leucine-rich repeat (LRR) protein
MDLSNPLGLVRCAVDFKRQQVLLLDIERQSGEFVKSREKYLSERPKKVNKQLIAEWNYEGKSFDDKIMEGLPNDNTVQKINMNSNNFTRADFISSKSLKSLYLNYNKINNLLIRNNYPSLTKLSMIDNQL